MVAKILAKPAVVAKILAAKPSLWLRRSLCGHSCCSSQEARCSLLDRIFGGAARRELLRASLLRARLWLRRSLLKPAVAAKILAANPPAVAIPAVATKPLPAAG